MPIKEVFCFHLMLFSLVGKEPKDQERLIARLRTRSAQPAMAHTSIADLAVE